MEDESAEPLESVPGGEEEYEDAAAKKRKGPLFKVLVLLIALIVSNSPPKASFAFSTVDFRLTVDARNSSDPDGNIATYQWDWGDGSAVTSGIQQAHTYASVNNYTVILTVTDARGAAGSASQIVRLRVSVTADFVARTEKMHVSFDASSSFSPSGGQVTAYSWDFGDGSSTGAGEFVTHDYATPGRYTVTLTAADSRGLTGQTSRLVSPAARSAVCWSAPNRRDRRANISGKWRANAAASCRSAGRGTRTASNSAGSRNPCRAFSSASMAMYGFCGSFPARTASENMRRSAARSRFTVAGLAPSRSRAAVKAAIRSLVISSARSKPMK